MAEENRAACVTMAGNIDRKTFQRFAMFDTFIRKSRWERPALFALILSAFAVVCFAGRQTHAQADLLGGVLLGIGLILPLVWVGMYAFSVSRQARRMGLAADRVQYYVTLSPEGIHVEKEDERADYLWGGACAAYRIKSCIYLYVSDNRAFLLPECADSDRAWALIAECLPREKLSVRGRRAEKGSEGNENRR